MDQQARANFITRYLAKRRHHKESLKAFDDYQMRIQVNGHDVTDEHKERHRWWVSWCNRMIRKLRRPDA
ncbi:hypothetical protein W911_11180 [Hyphomicrobium nitrativorans NL23]|uniref:Uncharacterized protein n=1 Tax=Hyphomicrobium nitrativorans NL23 TaxID=1029756 RepID=V5SJE1_9HYPH|nr:hypothetical protein [Hyphomicrobium nitrativorans]AHB50210.1 hypothetical protein W911_11180 [Hyphomicrobium nitrativorans NL23]